MVTDLIVTWPRNCDYPKWRKHIRDNRTKYNEVIISFMETNQGHDYRQFVRDAMFKDYVHFIDAPIPKPPQDWRDLAINSALLHSYNSPWVYFTEQDFYPLAGFWEQVEAFEREGYAAMAVYDGGRMHPCCIFLQRRLVASIGLDFGIIPDVSDHFSKIQIQLEAVKGIGIAKFDPSTYVHMAGLSSNLTLLNSGQNPNHNPDQFNAWMRECKTLDIEQDPHFLDLCSLCS